MNKIFSFKQYTGFNEALQKNGFSVSTKFDRDAITIHINSEGEEIEESISMEFEQKGGIVIFSTDVNAVKTSKSALVNKVKQIFNTYSNRLGKNSKITNIMKRHDDVYAFTIGNFVKGRYKADDGSLYDEKSTSVEVIGISSDTLIKLAEDLCKQFNQESVLVKDYQNAKIFLVKAD